MRILEAAVLCVGALTASCGDDTGSRTASQHEGDGGDIDGAIDASLDAAMSTQVDADTPHDAGDPRTDAALAAPRINTVTPARVAPGQAIVIRGERLRDVTRIWFGDVSAEPDAVANNEARATVPTLPFGTLELAVESNAGRSNTLELSVAAIPSIERLLPNDNPVGGPVLIRGRYLGDVQRVTFGGVSADVTVFSDTEVAVHVPDGLTTGRLDVQVETLADLSGKTPFDVLDAYPPGPASPPDIVPITKPHAGTFPPVTNVWSSDDECRYSVSFHCDGTGPQQLTDGTEDCDDQQSAVHGTWDTDALTVSWSIERASGTEGYQGSFIDSAFTELVLFSDATGRQLRISIGAAGYELCDALQGFGLSCECADGYLCGDEGYIDKACFDRQCERCMSP